MTRSWRRLIRYFFDSLCGAGLVLGTLLFVGSLTPSLFPRSYLIQGILSGSCFAVGYGLGVLGRWLWYYLELPAVIHSRHRHRVNSVILVVCVSAVILALWRAKYWQNSVRFVMDMAPVSNVHPLRISLIAILTFLLFLAVGRMFQLISRWISVRMKRLLPRRIANTMAVIGAICLFVLVIDGVIARGVMHMVDASFRKADALIPPDSMPPQIATKTGSADSLIAWSELGKAGRDFVSAGITAEQIQALTGRPAMEPIRVYVGLPAAKTPVERARLALQELQRVDAFSRSALVIITPTGTGWVDPAAIDSLEYLYRGDVASVAQQYSYLSSPLSLLVDPDYGEETARALFSEIYGYWRSLPEDQRPKLYLHGLSLGAMNSERSADVFEILGAPPAGALWSGPPFVSRHWRNLTAGRNAGSPAWLPEFRDSAFVRFINQDGSPVPADTPWGPMRVVYLQYASDAVTFFDYRDAYREPDWMHAPRGPDVSPALRWYPIVSMMQLALDMLISNNAPMGYGHVYAPSHYINAWMQVTGIQDWPDEDIANLKRALDAERLRSLEENARSD
ncbi:MAG: alpha/beta-hydrolase family protein [Xanthomonadaceae bacterium]|nr:alpha/beta-hydrolase family protein [Xanthomonadaceae bacterium]